jgi:DNA-binding response OmpR family regulator
MAEENILLIDDDPMTLRLLEEQLSAAGYRIFTSLSGEQGVEIAKSLNPNLIVLDLKMPKMDGFQVMRSLREDGITKDIPVMMLTAVKDRETVTKAMRSGIIDYIVKPFDIESFRGKIKAALRYSDMKRRELAEERSELIYTSRDEEMVLISFRSNLSNKALLHEAKVVFNAFFFKQITTRDCIIDLRAVPEFEPADIKVLEVLLKLFIDRNVMVVAGRHYGAIMADADFEEFIQIFISFGDMELYRMKKRNAGA